MQIYADLLRAVKEEQVPGEGARITPVQNRANLPSDRTRRYLAELVERGLLRGPPYQLTPKGEEFLREFARYRGFLRDFGLLGESLDKPGDRPGERPGDERGDGTSEDPPGSA